jgi:hypothetical protein
VLQLSGVAGAGAGVIWVADGVADGGVVAGAVGACVQPTPDASSAIITGIDMSRNADDAKGEFEFTRGD